VAGCTTNPGSRSDQNGEDHKPFSVTFARNSDAPAPDVPGAKNGGVITDLSPSDFQSIDPAQISTTNEVILSDLLYRTLTASRETGTGGLEVVGDLATNAGESTDGGRTWTYTLRAGLKYEDGRPITARDVAYGLARSYAPQLALGGRLLQQWLAGSDNYNKDYKGPYGDEPDMPPNVEVRDDRTIVFTFDRPRPYFPYLLAATSSTAPVPKDKDTRERYGGRPVASGPYRVASYLRGQRLVLQRNTFWDATTDAVRHQYVDGFDFVFGQTPLQISERLIANRGPDQTATTSWPTAPEMVPRVVNDPAARKRVTEGSTGTVQYLYINTRRVTDLKVRQALNYAIDRQALVKAQGGPVLSEPATTILSPLIPGYQQYNAYDGGSSGDPEKARQLLGGRTVELTYAHGNTPVSQRRALVVKTALERAGFRITLQPLDQQTYYAQVSKPGNPYDLIGGGISGVWPDGTLFVRSQFDGRQIRVGGVNLSLFNDSSVNARIDSLLAETDHDKAVAGWATLDREIMEKHAPVIPLTHIRTFTLSGSRVGGANLSLAVGLRSLRSVYVK
jgi:peptide/nickel transport system substrate-binding protein